MKRLLIITAWYQPFIHPRAHRWTAIAEYWAAQGMEVHVVCARRRGHPKLAQAGGLTVHRVGFDSLKEWVYFWWGEKRARGRIRAGAEKPGLATRISGWLYNVVWKKLYFPDDAAIWYFPARKKVFELLDTHRYDALISVSLPFTGHLLGMTAKRRYPGLRWIADIGDPFTIQAAPPNNAWLYEKKSARLERCVLLQSDACVVTNEAAIAAYCEKFGPQAVSRMTVIGPLLHPPFTKNRMEEAPGDGPPAENSHPAVINMGYFGAFYKPVRTPDGLLQLMERTFRRRPEWRERLLIHLFGDVFPEFWNALTNYPNLRLYGLRSRQETRAAMEKMDILLSIGNTTEFQLPSKTVEYYASGKPVIHLSSVAKDPFLDFWGDAPGLCVVQVENGSIGEAALLRWLAFLDTGWTASNAGTRVLEASAYQIESVALAYERLFKGLTLPISVPGKAEAPEHH